jgi:hypothetical protein
MVLIAQHGLLHIVADVLDVRKRNFVILHSKHFVDHAGIPEQRYVSGKMKAC